MDIAKGGIAFFDSGIGGMTVLAACRKYLKNEILYYYGDNVHAPYGNLSSLKIQEYVRVAFDLFQELNVKAAVVACNTATAVCIEALRARYEFPVVGAEPALRLAARAGGTVLVLATRATCESGRFHRLRTSVQSSYPQTRLTVVACEELAGMIERHIALNSFDYTSYFPRQYANSVVLGCTHYIYIEHQLRRFYRCPIYHGNEGIARRLLNILDENREGRPQCVFKGLFEGWLTTNFPAYFRLDRESLNANKSSPLNILNRQEFQGGDGIFFLGESGRKNAQIYERMFVCGQDGGVR